MLFSSPLLLFLSRSQRYHQGSEVPKYRPRHALITWHHSSMVIVNGPLISGSFASCSHRCQALIRAYFHVAVFVMPTQSIYCQGFIHSRRSFVVYSILPFFLPFTKDRRLSASKHNLENRSLVYIAPTSSRYRNPVIDAYDVR
ncbi:hypothetical protein M413DRAFT_271755 [Hebeloma cylindrosporum]|uniref:Uncharacterized protein n=1 Tax=Hebeloma cylindrosporum TaxID=76867 RepID=A0A0C2YBN7_HEBCY|nr:hypothetical protein M413DRAFT_271755 [Hebeloma cylindrosporum h7]